MKYEHFVSSRQKHYQTDIFVRGLLTFTILRLSKKNEFHVKSESFCCLRLKSLGKY